MILNQKGIIWLPIIFWGAIALLTGTAIIKNVVIPNITENTKIVDETPNPTSIECLPGQIKTTSGAQEICLNVEPTKQQIQNTSNNQPQVTYDGSRTDKIIPYTEYCSGKQISVYENEIIVKSSSFDGKTYGMTQGDWDCYNANPVINCNISPNCGGGSIQIKKSQCDQLICCELGKNSWNLYSSKADCTQAQNNYNSNRSTFTYTPLVLPEFEITPFPTVVPYQYSQEYLNSIEKFNQEISKPWKPTQFTTPVTKCYATWDDYFNAHPNYARQNITGMSTTPPCD